MSLPADYVSRSAGDKLDLLWQNVSADRYPEGALPTRIPSDLSRLRLLSVGFNRPSFEHVSDELPAGRDKIIHVYGTCARVTLRITGEHPYTGVFASGGAALVRFSDSAGRKHVTPSVALKFPVSGRPSLNYFASPAKVGRPPRGFLSVPLSNSLPDGQNLGEKLVQNAFQRTAKALGGKRLYAKYLPLHDLAQWDLEGRPVAEPVVPDRMELHATDEALDAVGRSGDWRARLAVLPAGTRLFEVRFSGKIDAPATAAAELVMDSEFAASRYGDERLFFQHHVGPT